VISEEEVKELHKKLKERTDECDEMKARFRHRSANNEELQNLQIDIVPPVVENNMPLPQAAAACRRSELLMPPGIKMFFFFFD
jgi:hypothetical protein